MTGKKSGEIIQGGIQGIKYAATSVAKKLDEIKEAISANTTPVKTSASNSLERDQHLISEDDLYNDESNLSRSRRASDLDLLGRLSESRKSSYNNLVPLGENSASNGRLRYPSLPENLYSHPEDSPDFDQADVSIELTSCSQCHNCSLLLYDEDIMAGWSAEDSNLNTTCHECRKLTVPFLTVQMTTVNHEDDQEDQRKVERQKVPYLNPLVLRKELENIMSEEGHHVLCQRQFVDEHPIIYWNLVWIMDRVDVNTHLPSLCQAEVKHDVVDDPLSKLKTGTVLVRCLWDNLELHTEAGLPMYVLWQQNPQASALVNALVTDQNVINRT